MRIVTINVNGIRSAAQKGLFSWLAEHDADVVCMQEIKAQVSQLQTSEFWPAGYHGFYVDAEKKGYSGVAIYSRRPPDAVVRGFGWPEVDIEGRYLEARFGQLSVVSLYAPSGSSGPERQAAKFAFLDKFEPWLAEQVASGREYILCGDFNIAHRPIDLKNWRSNQKNSGFLPEERAFLDRVFDGLGWVDAFRAVNVEPDQYTWWSNRGQAWAKNVGWRIDYHVVTPQLRECVRSAAIYKAQRFSDHAPLTIDYAWHW